MGIRIVSSFTTSEGFTVSEVYARITFVSVHLNSLIVSIIQEFSLTRDFRINAKTLSSVPFTTDTLSFQAVAFPTLEMAYFRLKRQLTKSGLVVEDVLEEGQYPSTYTEPEEVETPAQTTTLDTLSLAPEPSEEAPAVE